MKKNNLFFAFIFICLAIMVAVGSVLGVAAQVQPLQLQAASSTTSLFDANGNYAVSRTAIAKDKTFNFFGFDWKVVYVNGDIATFWMLDPYTTHVFNEQPEANMNLSVNNVWSNGYTGATLKVSGVETGVKGESSIRAFLRDEAKRLLDKDEYKAYRDKVMPGYQAGSNFDSSKTVKTIAYQENVKIDTTKGQIDSGVAYARSSNENIYTGNETKSSTMDVDYSLSTNGVDDVWWLPATEEVMDGGIWGLDVSYRNWTSTSVANLAWLRTPDTACNFRAWTVACNKDFDPDKYGFTFDTVDQTVKGEYKFGVRPAIHMNIASASATVGNGSDNGNSKGGLWGWFTDDMMKVFFIIICVLGVVAIALVVIAVVRKARERKQQGN